MSKILIIGNGFDLNLGLKTSYSHFIHSEQLQNLISNGNQLAAHLNKKHTLQNWVDIEHELKQYLIRTFKIKLEYEYERNNEVVLTEQEQQDQLKYEFIALKNALAEYLIQSSKTIRDMTDNNSQAAKILRCGYSKNLSTESIRLRTPYFNEIFTFNYTNFFNSFFIGNDRKFSQIHHIHGSLENNNIVFGIEDDAFSLKNDINLLNSAPHLKYSSENHFTFLNKSDHFAFGKAPDVSNAIANSHEIHFFGCSLGDTDNAHFRRAFKEISTQISPKTTSSTKRKIYFYVYGKTGYRSIYNRIMALTDSQVSEFKLINDVTFYDLKEDKEIDQEWLNQ